MRLHAVHAHCTQLWVHVRSGLMQQACLDDGPPAFGGPSRPAQACTHTSSV